MKNLRERAVSGLGWNAATQALTKFLQFAVLIVLAHLLTPHEFGLIGMILVFTGLASSIADMGLGASIVQAREVTDRNLNSVFWLNLIFGGSLTIVFILAAPLISGFYGDPQLTVLTAVVAFNFLIESTGVVQNALLQKTMAFRKRFWIEATAISISGIIALTLAILDAGVWSLVAQLLCGSTVRNLTLWRLSSWRPRLVFDLPAIRELLRFGQHLIGSNIVGYCAQYVDKLVIGHQIGTTALGLYNLSDRLMRLPLTNITGIADSVMFPALSKLQDDVEPVKRAYLKANRLIALLTFPMMMGLSALAQPAILLVYGDHWSDAVPVVQVLCFAGLAQSVYNTASWIFLAFGRPDILLRLTTLSLTVRVAGVFIGMRWGLIGIASAYVLGGYIFLLYPTWASVERLIGLRFGILLKNVAASFCCALLMAVIVWFSDQWLLFRMAYWLRLLTGGLIGLAIYGSLVTYMNLAAWQDLRDLILVAGGRKIRLVRFLLENGTPANPASEH